MKIRRVWSLLFVSCLIGITVRVGAGSGADEDLLRRLAERGDPAAQYQLGMQFGNKGETPENTAAMAKWLKKAAEQGHPKAQFGLAALYGTGQGVPQDWVQALMWLELAAARGAPDIQQIRQSFVARMTSAQVASAKKLAEDKLQRAHWEEDPETSFRKARAEPGGELRWFRERAERGDPGAQFNYGIMLLGGDPKQVPHDEVEGLMWLTLARKGGPEFEEAYSKLITREIPADILAEAERRAKEWRPKK